jgi:hypothetical protein
MGSSNGCQPHVTPVFKGIDIDYRRYNSEDQDSMNNEFELYHLQIRAPKT